jgi:hypothetical protein
MFRIFIFLGHSFACYIVTGYFFAGYPLVFSTLMIVSPGTKMTGYNLGVYVSLLIAKTNHVAKRIDWLAGQKWLVMGRFLD